MRTLALVVVLFASAACASVPPTPYQPSDADGFGYTEFVRADGVVVVTYRGNGRTAVPDAERFAMCRAAEVVASQGKPMFAVLDRQTGSVAGDSSTHCAPGGFGTTQCSTHTLSRPVVTLTVRPVMTAEDASGAVYTAGSNFKRCQRVTATQ